MRSAKETSIREREFFARVILHTRRVVHESTAIKCDSWWEKKRSGRRDGAGEGAIGLGGRGRANGATGVVRSFLRRERASDAMPGVP